MGIRKLWSHTNVKCNWQPTLKACKMWGKAGLSTQPLIWDVLHDGKIFWFRKCVSIFSMVSTSLGVILKMFLVNVDILSEWNNLKFEFNPLFQLLSCFFFTKIIQIINETKIIVYPDFDVAFLSLKSQL